MTETEFKTKIADQLIIYRKAFGYTQIELAEKINYSDKSVSKWERAESMPDIFVLSKIADVYKITVSDLIGETEPKKDLSKAIKKAKGERIQNQRAKEKARKKEEKARMKALKNIDKNATKK
ncbi:MAG: helix-turn-helix transcriptional regulator [Oscillospiraceae bacterium]|nr:helix-turn-helix transcriptional regulator [Oscillospiraceae bacterium]